MKFFPHTVADLEPLLDCLECQDVVEYETWESRYSLLLWMSIVVLIPFDLASVDSGDERGSLADRLIGICKGFLADSGATRDMAALLLSKLLSRKDMKSQLSAFIGWCVATLSLAPSVFLYAGVFASLCCIFKQVSREILLEYVEPLSKVVLTSLESTKSTKLAVKLLQRLGLFTFLRS